MGSDRRVSRELRKLHESYVAAGKRRLIVRALARDGYTRQEIANLLGVTAKLVQSDIERSKLNGSVH